MGDARAAPAASHLVEEAPRDLARERRLALGDAAEELGDAARRLALQQVAGRAAADRREEVLLRPRGRQHDDLATRRGLTEPRQGLQAGQARHRQVEEDEPRLEPPRAPERLLSIRGLADDGEAVLR